MRNKKAKAIKKAVYGEDAYTGPKNREYKTIGRTIYATGNRKIYQEMKRKFT